MQAVAYRKDLGRRFSPALCVRCDYVQKDRVKTLGGVWDPGERCWELPYTAEDWQSILLSIPGIAPDEGVRRDFAGEESDTSRPAPEAAPMPLKPGIVPFRHQQAAYAEAISLFEGGERCAG